MSKSILLLNQPPTNKRLYVNVLPPLGMLWVASYLKSKGIEVKAIDGNVEVFDEKILYDYDIIAMSVGMANIKKTIETVKSVKQNAPDKIFVCGGVYATQDPAYLLNNGFDAVVTGEGEITFYEYVTQENKENVKGLYLLKDGVPFFTGIRPKIMNLDEMPFPALEFVDLKKYKNPIGKKKPLSSIMTSRGCPHECIYCFHDRTFRVRSPENVVDEIEWQVNKFGVKELCIIDDNFTLDLRRAERICDLIIERKIKVVMQCWNGIRVDRVTKSLLAKMKKAGIWMVAIAPETGSEDTLLKIKKRFTLEQVRQARAWCKEVGIKTYSFFMIGFPWENKELIQQTIDFANELDTEFTQFSRVYPMMGTELYEDVKDQFQIERTDEGFFYGGSRVKVKGMDEEEVEKMVRKAYRSIYLKPRKMFQLMTTLKPNNLFELFKYSILTRSIA